MPRRRQAKLTAGKANYVSPNRGLALLDEALEQIELQAKAPEGKGQWNQESWRCGSGMCLAGWLAQLAGGYWATPADGNGYEDYLIAEPDEDQDERYEGKPVVHVSERAEKLLGITEDDLDSVDLFGPNNTLENLRELRDELAYTGKIA